MLPTHERKLVCFEISLDDILCVFERHGYLKKLQIGDSTVYLPDDMRIAGAMIAAPGLAGAATLRLTLLRASTCDSSRRSRPCLICFPALAPRILMDWPAFSFREDTVCMTWLEFFFFSPSPSLPQSPGQLDALCAVLEVLPLAERGELIGCDCAAKGHDLPCPHVLEAADDPLLPLIRQSERATGAAGAHNLAAAAALARELELKSYRPSHRPTTPTDAEPGTYHKRRLMRERLKKHESLDRPGDKRHEPARCHGEATVGSAWTDEDDDDA